MKWSLDVTEDNHGIEKILNIGNPLAFRKDIQFTAN